MNRAECSDGMDLLKSQARPWTPILVLLAVVAVVEINAFVNMLQSGGSQDALDELGESSPLALLAKLCFGVYGVAWLFAKHRNLPNINGIFGLLLAAFFTCIFASVLWADNPSFVLKRVLVFAMMLAAAYAVADRFSLRNFMELGFWCALLSLGVGLIAELLLQKFTPFAAEYRFGGTIHPNNQGWNCSALCLSAICLAPEAVRFRRFLYVVAAVAFLFLLLTGSRTALGSTGAALLTLVAIRTSPTRLLAIGLTTVTVLLLALLFVDESKITRTFLYDRQIEEEEGGSAATLTGRTHLWEEFGAEAAKRPLLGYGYGAFWTPARIAEIADAEGWTITHPHSSYLDIMLDLGLVGAALFVAVNILGIYGYIRRYREDGALGHAWAAALLDALAVNMLLESRFRFTDISIFVFLSLALWVRLGFISAQSLKADGNDRTAESDALEPLA